MFVCGFKVAAFEFQLAETINDAGTKNQSETHVGSVCFSAMKLATAHKQVASREILLWMTPSEAPKALQASECSELLDPMRANCWISAQH